MDKGSYAEKINAHTKKASKVYFYVTWILAIILIVWFIMWIVKKDKFAMTPWGGSSNLQTGSNSPLWWNGSGNAGYGGSLARSETGFALSQLVPGLDKYARPGMYPARDRPDPLSYPQMPNAGSAAAQRPFSQSGNFSEGMYTLDYMKNQNKENYVYDYMHGSNTVTSPQAESERQALEQIGSL